MSPAKAIIAPGTVIGGCMAGYMFTLDSIDSLHRCVEDGVYATYITEPRGAWGVSAEGTFADYATMTEGDNVYFFIDRRIYGIGELVRVGPDCKYENFPGASRPDPIDYEASRSEMLVDSGLRQPESGSSRAQRWACVFRPSPFFFVEGVDMDDALSSDPAAFRSLRAIWKLSFIKFDDEENQAFRNAILKLNQRALARPEGHENVFEQKHRATHERIAHLVADGAYDLDAAPLVEACATDGRLRHEMALEAGLLQQLATRERATTAIFGSWDYLSHQVIASPFKPIDYMDKMDVFGSAYIPGYRPTVASYLVAELKKDAATTVDVEQVMKYVDWVKEEYAHGDYSMIRAFMVASEVSDAVLKCAEEVATRFFTIQRRPARTQGWSGLRLLRYRVTPAGLLVFKELVPERPTRV